MNDHDSNLTIHRAYRSRPRRPALSVPRRAVPGFAVPWAAALLLLVALLASCAPTEGDTGEFEVVKTTNEDFDVRFVDVGIFPIVLGVGDLDNDDDVDVAVSNRFDDTVTVLTEGLNASATLDVGIEPTDVVFGDFNGAGNLDLAVLDQNNTRLSIFMATGGGGWAAPDLYELDGVATQVTALDLDGVGGALDLVISVTQEDQILALVNDGAGNFSPVLSDANDSPTRYAARDWDGDGNQDLAVLNPPADEITILMGDGTGAFTRNPLGGIDVRNNPIQITVFDVNGDGDLDLAVVSRLASDISILLGDGNGGFDVLFHDEVGGSPDAVVAGAFDTSASGTPNDLAIVHRGSTRTAVLLWNGSNDFDRINYGVTEDPFAIVSGDFNLDGCADLITAESRQRALSVLAGDCTGEFTRTAIGFTGEVGFPVVTDLDSDGAEDVVLVQTQSQRIVVLTNRN